MPEMARTRSPHGRRPLEHLLGRHLPPPATVQAAALTPSTLISGGWGTGGEFLAPVDFAPPAMSVWDRSAAISIPTISRCRDLICNTIGALPLTQFRVDWNADPPIERSTPPAGWMQRPDPNRPRQWILSWTSDDLYFYAVAYWRVVTRYADQFPASFQRMPAVEVSVNMDGEVTWQNEWWIRANDDPAVDPGDVIEFLSPSEGLLSNGYRAIGTALMLDSAAERFAGTEVPAGWLQEREGGEDLSADDLTTAAQTWTAARRSNTTAAINKYFEYHESTADPGRMQLVQSRAYQALELARLGNVPPYLVGAPAGTGMTYQNAVQARSDLIDFGAMPYIGCIEQTLSGNNVTPRGLFVRLDTNAWLRNPLSDSNTPSPNDMQQAFNTPDPLEQVAQA